jgi:hypothetical protein
MGGKSFSQRIISRTCGRQSKERPERVRPEKNLMR